MPIKNFDFRNFSKTKILDSRTMEDSLTSGIIGQAQVVPASSIRRRIEIASKQLLPAARREGISQQQQRSVDADGFAPPKRLVRKTRSPVRPLPLPNPSLPRLLLKDAFEREIETISDLAKLIAPSFNLRCVGRFLKVTAGDELEYREPQPLAPNRLKTAWMPPKIYDFTELFFTPIEVKPFEKEQNWVNRCWRCQGWFHSSEGACCSPPLLLRPPYTGLSQDASVNADALKDTLSSSRTLIALISKSSAERSKTPLSHAPLGICGRWIKRILSSKLTVASTFPNFFPSSREELP
ncbi:hypothetical protein TNCV_576241 [Trichonephila clavipes]|nr:hypothetical protein TNCV_576241 [Trichonephila clavipes]